MRFLYTLLLLGTLIGLVGRAAGAERSELRLVGMAVSGNQFVLFVSVDGASAKSVTAIGSAVESFQLAAVDYAKGFADFKRADGSVERVALGEGHVRMGTAATTAITIPPLTEIKGLIGLDEFIARHGKETAEKLMRSRLEQRFNDPRLPWAERMQSLGDLISGKTHNILVPLGGVTEAFAQKYQLTPEEVRSASWGEEVGRQFAKSRKTATQ